eukprot:scaffold1605_cov365-Pavlova_lutheri.AAC.7
MGNGGAFDTSLKKLGLWMNAMDYAPRLVNKVTLPPSRVASIQRRKSIVQANRDDGPERTGWCRALDRSHECDLGYLTCMT